MRKVFYRLKILADISLQELVNYCYSVILQDKKRFKNLIEDYYKDLHKPSKIKPKDVLKKYSIKLIDELEKAELEGKNLHSINKRFDPESEKIFKMKQRILKRLNSLRNEELSTFFAILTSEIRNSKHFSDYNLA